MSKWYVLIFTLFFSCSTFAQTSSIQVQLGWNLLSLPVSVPDNARDVLFPSARSKAFIYSSGYQAIDSIINGQGFWLKFDFTETISITGEEIYTDTIEVSAGWNMIGSLTMPISVSSIKTDPPAIIVSDYYGYTNGAYQSVNILQPGSGAWVKVSQDGLIILFSPRPCPGTPTISYAGKTYNTVLIGDQCWLKENLDVGTMILGTDIVQDNGIIEKYCYNDNIENCNVYGGLYQWDEAMQYFTSESSQGICPDGWHMPSYNEYQICSTYVSGESNSLKEIGQGIGDGAGTNTSGFSGLLAGIHSPPFNDFMELLYYLCLWSSSEIDSQTANYMNINYHNSGINIYRQYKHIGHSIRCIRGTGANPSPNQPSNPYPPDSAIGQSLNVTLDWSCSDPDGDSLKYDVYFGLDNPPLTIVSLSQEETHYDTLLNSATTYYWKVAAKDNHGHVTQGPVWSFTTMGAPCPGTPTVEYAGKTYNTVQIGSQCWLKENLDVGIMIDSLQDQTDNSTVEKYCYHNDPSNCNTYGGLYQWNEAMQYSTSEGARGICPEGWHIPKIAEFQTLITAVGGEANSLKREDQGSGSGQGINTSGLSMLLVGWRSCLVGGNFIGLSEDAWIWSSSSYQYINLIYLDNTIYIDSNNLNCGFSVRCLKD